MMLKKNLIKNDVQDLWFLQWLKSENVSRCSGNIPEHCSIQLSEIRDEVVNTLKLFSSSVETVMERRNVTKNPLGHKERTKLQCWQDQQINGTNLVNWPWAKRERVWRKHTDQDCKQYWVKHKDYNPCRPEKEHKMQREGLNSMHEQILNVRRLIQKRRRWSIKASQIKVLPIDVETKPNVNGGTLCHFEKDCFICNVCGFVHELSDSRYLFPSNFEKIHEYQQVKHVVL